MDPCESQRREQDHGATDFLSYRRAGGNRNGRTIGDHAGFPLKGPVIGVKLAEEILRAYLNARFSTDEDFRRRVRKLDDLEAFRPEK
jgi:hypothetical protein